MNRFFRCNFVLLGLGALLGGCSVYVPMLGAAPEIRQKGEVEVTGAWSLTNRVDASVTYSPLNHLLVHAATSSKGGGHQESNDSSSFAQNNQYELAVGTYWPLGKQWLVGGLAGFGQAHSEARYTDDGDVKLNIFGNRQPIQHEFDAIYAKYSAEVYGIWQPSERVSLGLTYRLVQLRLTDVTDRYVPVQAGPILRSEPMLFLRVRPGEGLLQLQAAVGASGTIGYDRRAALDETDPARQFKLGNGYLSLGVAFYPHLLWQKK
jgi:hypothetical protein